MNFSVIPTPNFKKEVKRLIKKYPSLRSELIDLSNSLTTNPALGISIGNNCFKIRVSIKSKGKGKSGGARVITYLLTEKLEVYLLTIYDKSEFSSVGNSFLIQIISSLKNN